LALLSLLATRVGAQTPGSVTGTVQDQVTKEPLLGATVRWAGQPGGATTTNLAGAFQLHAPRQPDTLVVSYVGYRTCRQVLARTGTPLAVRLVPAGALTLAQVAVTAKRPIAEDFMVQELGYLNIVTNPAAAADPLLAVRTLPAATSLDESASISLRGSDPSQTGIYLNNVPIYDAVKFAQLSGLGTFSIFSADLLRSVLVFPSNPPLEFGNAGAGLLSLSTDERRRDRFVQASLGLANSGLLLGQPVGKRGMLKAYLNGQQGGLLRLLNPTALQQLPHLSVVDGGVHWATALGPHGTLKAFAYAVREQYTYTPTTGGAADYQYHNQRGFYTLNYERTWPRADLTLSHGLSQYRATTAFGTYHLTRRGGDYFAAAHYRRYWRDALSTRAGLSYDERELTLAGEFPVSNGPDFSGAEPTYAATFSRGRTLWEAYQYTKYTRGAWVAGAALRLNALPRSVQPGYGSWQLNLRRNFSSHRFLNLAAGQYHSVTSPDLVRVGFLATRVRQVALDYAATSPTAEGSTFTAAVYAKQEESLLLTRVLGAEFFGQRTFFGHLRADLAAAAVYATPFGYDEQNLQAQALARTQARYVLPFQLKSTLRWAGKWGEVGAFVQYRAGARYFPVLGAAHDPVTGAWQPRYGTETSLPTYFRADVTASKVIRRSNNPNMLVLFATCGNLFDTCTVSRYAYSADYTQAVPEYFQRRLVYFGLVKTWQ
jgi:hypothetical protein